MGVRGHTRLSLGREGLYTPQIWQFLVLFWRKYPTTDVKEVSENCEKICEPLKHIDNQFTNFLASGKASLKSSQASKIDLLLKISTKNPTTDVKEGSKNS